MYRVCVYIYILCTYIILQHVFYEQNDNMSGTAFHSGAYDTSTSMRRVIFVLAIAGRVREENRSSREKNFEKSENIQFFVCRQKKLNERDKTTVKSTRLARYSARRARDLHEVH